MGPDFSLTLISLEQLSPFSADSSLKFSGSKPLIYIFFMLFIFDDFFSPRSITYVIVSLSLHSTYIIYMFGQLNFHFDFHLNDFHDFLPLPQKLKMPKRNTLHPVSLLLEGDAVDRDETLD